MMGAAPVAAVMPKEAANLAPPNYAAKMVDVGGGVFDYAEASPVFDRFEHNARRARKELLSAKWLKEKGLLEPERTYSKCPCIDSRKATSPAVKAILQDEHEAKMEIYRQEIRWKKAVAKKLAPPWIRAYFESNH